MGALPLSREMVPVSCIEHSLGQRVTMASKHYTGSRITRREDIIEKGSESVSTQVECIPLMPLISPIPWTGLSVSNLPLLNLGFRSWVPVLAGREDRVPVRMGEHERVGVRSTTHGL